MLVQGIGAPYITQILRSKEGAQNAAESSGSLSKIVGDVGLFFTTAQRNNARPSMFKGVGHWATKIHAEKDQKD